MANPSPSLLSDQELLEAAVRVADDERRTTAELIALLAELDLRKLHLGQGYSSLFTYCTQALRLSESAAYSRITAARATRRFPMILALLTYGDITMTTVSLLAAHLTDENHEALLDAARYKNKRDIEQLVASLCAQPDIPASVRRLPTLPVSLMKSDSLLEPSVGEPRVAAASVAMVSTTTARPVRTCNAVAPLATDRYLMRITITGATHARFERARDLLRHAIPGGDPVAIIDRALTVLVEQLERQKIAAVRHPRALESRSIKGRRVPAAIRRTVWTRDQGRCAFVGTHGRCAETGFLEFHHVVPFAADGPATADNMELRCRAHNAFEAESYFGPDRVSETFSAPSTAR